MAEYVFQGTVTQFCKYGGKKEEYHVTACSIEQAKARIRISFNGKHGFVKERFVEMKDVRVYESTLSPPPKLSS